MFLLYNILDNYDISSKENPYFGIVLIGFQLEADDSPLLEISIGCCINSIASHLELGRYDMVAVLFLIGWFSVTFPN